VIFGVKEQFWLRNQLYSMPCNKLEDQLDSQFYSLLRGQLREFWLRGQLGSQLYSPLYSQLGGLLYSQLYSLLYGQLREDLKKG